MKKQITLLVFIFFIITNVFAQTHTWTGNGNNYSWSDPQNWDQGTIPLVDGIGTVIIPEGYEVHSGISIDFKYGEFKGGGTFYNDGELNLINNDEVLTSKVFSNITILSSQLINIYRAPGITNTDPILLNEGAFIKSGYASSVGSITLNSIGISFNTPSPGTLEINSDFLKIGAENVIIDVEMIICCYDFKVSEGLLIIEPFTSNTILGPYFDIQEGASLVLKGNTIFSDSGSSIDGNIQGILEITDSQSSNPLVNGPLFFNTEGDVTLNNVTFQGGGTMHWRTNTFIPESSIVIFDGPRFITSETFKTSPQSEVILKNTSDFINSNNGHMILNGGSITGLNNEEFKNYALITIVNNSTFNLNGVYFNNSEIIDLQTGSFIMDNTTFFEGYYSEIFNPYGELIGIEYSEILGSGYIKFPANSTQNNENNGFLIPGPGIEEINTDNFAQTEIGYIQIDIESLSSFDKISNTGTTYFEGNIEVVLGFSPAIGDEFIIYESDSPLTNCQPVSTTSAVFNNFNYVFDVICNSDNITLRLSEILSNNEFDLTNNSFYCYPNPVNSVSTFNISPELLSSENNSIFIYNYLGQLVREIEINNNSFINFEKGNLSSGIYFAKLKSNSTLTIKIIIE